MSRRSLRCSIVAAFAGFLFSFDIVLISHAEQEIQSLGHLCAGIHCIAVAWAPELSPPKNRGLWAGAGPNAWRWMLGVAAFPSLVYNVSCLGLPGRPRWLISRKNDLRRMLVKAPAEQGAVASFWNWKLRLPVSLAVCANTIPYFAPRIFGMTGLGAQAVACLSTSGSRM